METIKNVLGMGHHKDETTATGDHTSHTSHTGPTAGHDTTTETGHANPHAATDSTHTGVTDKGSNLTSRYGLNDNVAKPQDEGTTVVGGGFPSKHTGDHYIPTKEAGQGKEIYGRGTTGEHFGERTGPIPETIGGQGVGHGEGQSTNAIGGHRGNVDPTGATTGTNVSSTGATTGATGREHHHLPPPPAGAGGHGEHPGGIVPQGLTGTHTSGGVGVGIDARGGANIPSGQHHDTLGSTHHHGTHTTSHHDVGIAPPLAKGTPASATGVKEVNVGSTHTGPITSGGHVASATGQHGLGSTTGHTGAITGHTGTTTGTGHGLAAAAAREVGATGNDTTHHSSTGPHGISSGPTSLSAGRTTRSSAAGNALDAERR